MLGLRLKLKAARSLLEGMKGYGGKLTVPDAKAEPEDDETEREYGTKDTRAVVH